MRCLVVGLVGVALAATGCGISPEYRDEVQEAHDVVADEDASDGDDARPAHPSIVGRWSGTGHQNDGSSWRIEVDVARVDGGPCAIVRYPELDCAGYWECSQTSNLRRLRAVERITHGRDKCVDRVDVQLKLYRGEGAVFKAHTGDIVARGRLQPVR
jgi:hypothetical protein